MTKLERQRVSMVSIMHVLSCESLKLQSAGVMGS